MQSYLAYDRRHAAQGARQSTSSLRFTATMADCASATSDYNSRHHHHLPAGHNSPSPPVNANTAGGAPYPNSYSTLSNYDGSSSPGPYGSPQTMHHPRAMQHHPRMHPPPGGQFLPALNTTSAYFPSPGMTSPTSPASPTSPRSGQPKTYKCDVCSAAFTRAHDRKRHLATHNRPPDGGPKCEWCHKSFSRGDALKRHMDNGCDYMPDHEYELRQSRQLRNY